MLPPTRIEVEPIPDCDIVNAPLRQTPMAREPGAAQQTDCWCGGASASAGTRITHGISCRELPSARLTTAPMGPGRKMARVGNGKRPYDRAKERDRQWHHHWGQAMAARRVSAASLIFASSVTGRAPFNVRWQCSNRPYAGLSHASNTNLLVRYSPKAFSSLFFSTRKVSPGKSRAVSAGSRRTGSCLT
jgi:hypothetical protein